MEKAHEKFLHEAGELMDALEKAVLQLDKERHDASQVEEVFRVMHTFKGTAKMFGFDRVGEFTHHLENIFDDVRRGRIELTDEILEITLSSVDYLRMLLDTRESDHYSDQHDKIMLAVKRMSGGKSNDHVEPIEKSIATTGKLVLIFFRPHQGFTKSGNRSQYLIDDVAAHGITHIKTFKEESSGGAEVAVDHESLYWNILLFTQSDLQQIRNEFLFVEDLCDLTLDVIADTNLLCQDKFRKFVDEFEGILPSNLVSLFEELSHGGIARKDDSIQRNIQHKSQQSIKVTYEKIDKLMSIVSELVTTQARLSLFSEGSKSNELEEISENVEKLVRQLRDEAFSISLLPISHLSTRFERLVRDTSKELNKKVRFVTVGGDTELDKKIIENLMDPMLHILRNSIDHGIEFPEFRKRSGKDEVGTITLRSFYAGTDVMIEIQDDGSGIDKARVLQKALELKLAQPSEVLSDQEIYSFIFHPGFSTAQKITNVSGRGVGMDVVNRAIKNLRGEITVDSQTGKGSVIRMKLPLSLSIIDGLLVGVEQSNYVIPLTAIDKCFEMESELVKPDMHDLIVLDGEQIPYIALREVFGCKSHKPQFVNLVVARHEGQKVAFEVDTIIDEYQAVIKPLGKVYKEQDFASGATILGNGRVALVLDTNRLIERLSVN